MVSGPQSSLLPPSSPTLPGAADHDMLMVILVAFWPNGFALASLKKWVWNILCIHRKLSLQTSESHVFLLTSVFLASLSCYHQRFATMYIRRWYATLWQKILAAPLPIESLVWSISALPQITYLLCFCRPAKLCALLSKSLSVHLAAGMKEASGNSMLRSEASQDSNQPPWRGKA